VELSDGDASVDVFECDDCGNVGLGDGDITCCGSPMSRVDADPAVPEPSLGDLLGAVFGMSDAELDICLCVMEGGEQTAQELADRTDYDRSVAARHLNHLAELGVLEKRRRLLKAGGHIYVYAPRSAETVRREFKRQFLVWLEGAAGRLGEVRREKVEDLVDAERTDSQWTLYHEE
jgi:predicted transcriptional regulator